MQPGKGAMTKGLKAGRRTFLLMSGCVSLGLPVEGATVRRWRRGEGGSTPPASCEDGKRQGGGRPMTEHVFPIFRHFREGRGPYLGRDGESY